MVYQLYITAPVLILPRLSDSLICICFHLKFLRTLLCILLIRAQAHIQIFRVYLNIYFKGNMHKCKPLSMYNNFLGLVAGVAA